MALSWAVKNAKTFGITPAGLGVAGYEAGGNLATCLSAIVRDRREFRFSAQVLLAPLLDPSMTLLSEGSVSSSEDTELSKWSRQYRAYLPNVRHRMHPYAAPVDSVRLGGLAPAFIATVQNHMLRIEAEKYAKDLIAAGVPAAVIRYEHVSNLSIAASEQVFEDMTAFFQRQLAADQEGTAANRRKASHGPHCVLGPARTRDR